MELNKIYNMDCLEGIENLPDASIDCIITDPPYCSGGRQTNSMVGKKSMMRGDKWLNEWFGTDNMSTSAFLFFMRGLFMTAFQKIKVGGHCYVFIDWRNYPLLSNILETAGFRINNMIVWDKKHIGMGNGYRNQHELVIVCSKGSPREYNRKDMGNVFSYVKPLGDKHPTSKPVEILSKFVENSTSPGDVILDPFMGSGSTAVAAKKLNRQYVGFEIDEKFIKVAEERLAQETLPSEIKIEAFA